MRWKVIEKKDCVEIASEETSVRLVNLTPHTINIVLGPQTTIRVPPSGKVARVNSVTEVTTPIADIVPVVRTKFGDIEGLPNAEDGTIFITSTLVAQVAARQGRTDVVAPDTNSAIRDEDGRIVGVKRLQTFAEEVIA